MPHSNASDPVGISKKRDPAEAGSLKLFGFSDQYRPRPPPPLLRPPP
jgi:hypothetical protein